MYAPDPVLTASIHAGARLDAVLREGIAPFHDALSLREGEAWGGWFVRYARGGEHLKLRLHGPADGAESVRRQLSEIMCSLWADLPPLAVGEARPSRPDAPPVDVEDDTEADHPDRTLCWTTYRRSPVSLGPAHLLADDGYVARMVAALVAGSAAALAALGGVEPPGPAARQRSLLRALVEGLRALPLAPEARAEYLRYHRDWLLRFAAEDPQRERAARAAFEARGARMEEAVERLRGAMDAPSGGAPPPRGLAAAVAELHAYLAASPAREGGGRDPFAADPAFPPLFKVFHGLANQLGIHPLEEAFAHHLCLCAAGAVVPAGAGG